MRRSGSTTCGGTSGPGRPAHLFKLVDADNAVGKDGADIQLPPHGLDDLPKRADIHIGAALHFGNDCLIDVPQFRFSIDGLPNFACFVGYDLLYIGSE